jgi:hypothetical protein
MPLQQIVQSDRISGSVAAVNISALDSVIWMDESIDTLAGE